MMVLLLGLGLASCDSLGEALGITEPKDEEAPKFVSFTVNGQDAMQGFTHTRGEHLRFEVSMTDDGDFGDLSVEVSQVTADSSDSTGVALTFMQRYAQESRKDARQTVDVTNSANQTNLLGDYVIKLEVSDLAEHSTQLEVPLTLVASNQ